MAKPTVGQTGWGGILNDHLTGMETDIAARQVAADLEADVAAKVGTAGALDTALSASYVSGLVLSGAGIDPTGVADSTAAIQARIDQAGAFGADVYLPAGEYNITGTLTVSAERQRLFGPGTLKVTAGIANDNAVELTGEGSSLDGIRMINPNALGATTGAASFAVMVKAHNVKVTGCLIDGFQNGIGVDADGEWTDFTISGNRVKDVIGAALEDRGDGIVSWGARGTIVGNVVNCKAGSDARVGIHAEGLDEFATTTPSHTGRMVTIAGNTVFGQFRRGIVAENVGSVAITGNAVADSTWWAVALVHTTSGTIVGNSIRWTRQTTDTQGSAWSPHRAVIMLYGNVKAPTVANNTITLAGSAEALIYTQASGGGVEGGRIAGNSVSVESGSVTDGISLGVPTDVAVTGNMLTGFTGIGLYSYGATGATFCDNRIKGTPATSTVGIKAEGSATGANITGNDISDCSTGIERVNSSGNNVSNNLIKTASIGVEFFGSTDSKALGNVFVGVTTGYANAGGSGVVTS